MHFFNRLCLIALFLLGLSAASFAQGDTAITKPNIVIFLVDDSGLMDFGVYGGEARTPNIDRLAKNG